MSSSFSEFSNLFDKTSDVVDNCSHCSKKKNLHLCVKCGDAVCSNVECSLVFPHYNNTLLVICHECSDEIAQKMKLVINLGELKLLKRKIKNKLKNKLVI